MNIVELYNLLGQRMEGKTLAELEKIEVRIGDQIESGPYLNASVGGVWVSRTGNVILCANDDEVWKDEATGYHPDFELDKIWVPGGSGTETG